jgi:hypothetical protein
VRVQIELKADFGRQVQLSEIRQNKGSLLVHGIYVTTEGGPGEVLDPGAEASSR